MSYILYDCYRQLETEAYCVFPFIGYFWHSALIKPA